MLFRSEREITHASLLFLITCENMSVRGIETDYRANFVKLGAGRWTRLKGGRANSVVSPNARCVHVHPNAKPREENLQAGRLGTCHVKPREDNSEATEGKKIRLSCSCILGSNSVGSVPTRLERNFSREYTARRRECLETCKTPPMKPNYYASDSSKLMLERPPIFWQYPVEAQMKKKKW